MTSLAALLEDETSGSLISSVCTTLNVLFRSSGCHYPHSWGGFSFLYDVSKTFSFPERTSEHIQPQIVLGLFTSLCLWQAVTPNKEATQIRIIPISAKSLSILGHSWLNLWAESISCSLFEPGRAQPVITVTETCRHLWVISPAHRTCLLLQVHINTSFLGNWVRNVSGDEWLCQKGPLPIKALQLKGCLFV